MRIRATLREPLTAQDIGSKAEQETRIRQLLDEVGLSERALELYPHEFSGGQRQRIGLARALTVEPRLIVADEPVSALDVSIQSQILNLMKRLQGERDLTYIIISHDLAVVRYLADRVGVMYLGKLVEVGPAEDVYERAAHPYTAALLQAVPVPDPAIERSKTTIAVKGELPPRRSIHRPGVRSGRAARALRRSARRRCRRCDLLASRNTMLRVTSPSSRRSSQVTRRRFHEGDEAPPRVAGQRGSSMTPHIVVVGSTMIDVLMYADRTPERGQTVVGQRMALGHGGKGANQAAMAARLGARVTFVNRVGNDVFGDMTRTT